MLLGREQERREIEHALVRARSGESAVIALVGEPGIGKSHALRQLIDRARAGSALVLIGRCVEGAWVPPFRPFAEAIAGYGETAGPERLRADLGPAGAALVRIAAAVATKALIDKFVVAETDDTTEWYLNSTVRSPASLRVLLQSRLAGHES